MKTYKYITLAALALGFAACTQDDDFAPQQEDIVKIASANIATEVQTRVNTLDDGTQWENTDQILLVNNSRDNKNSGTYTYNDNAWSLTSGTVLYASGTNSFTAYYPAVVDFTLPTDQSDEAKIKSADRMTATADGVAKGEAVALSFERQNAMVTITPSFNTEFGDDATISSLQIAGITPFHPEDAEDYKAIIAPSTTGFEVSVKVKVGEAEQTLTANTTTAIEAGKHYTFNLTVGKTAVGITSVSVNDWTEKPVTGVETEQEAFVYNPATNSYEVHLSRGMQAAIDAAELTGTAENPATVTLLADMEVEGTPNEYGDIEQDILVDGGVIVLDLNGHTLKTANTSNNCLVYLRNGATLIIDDSSEEKSGKMITYDKTSDVIQANNGKLVINDGTFEGTYVIRGMDNNSTIEINGGTFIGTNSAMYAQSSILTITGGTFTADGHALYFTSRGKPTITGGSFSGGKYDIGTSGLTEFLSYNEETGEGPTFPGGLSIAGTTNNLNALLATGAAYYDANGNQLALENDATTCEGDVTVKIVNE